MQELDTSNSGSYVISGTPTGNSGDGWKKGETCYGSNALILNESADYTVSGVDLPIVLLTDAEVPGQGGTITDGSFTKTVSVVGGAIKNGSFSGDVELWLGGRIYDGVFEKEVSLEQREHYTLNSTASSDSSVYNVIYGGKFKGGLVSHYSGMAEQGSESFYRTKIYGGTFCHHPYRDDDFVGWGVGYYPTVYGGVFEAFDSYYFTKADYFKSTSHYTLTAENCTINDIITSGSAVIVPNTDAETKNLYPTRVSVASKLTGNVEWTVQLEGETGTKTLAEWGATDIVGENSPTATFTAPEGTTNVTLVASPVVAKEHTITVLARDGEKLTPVGKLQDAYKDDTVVLTYPGSLPEGKMIEKWVVMSPAEWPVKNENGQWSIVMPDNNVEVVAVLADIPATAHTITLLDEDNEPLDTLTPTVAGETVTLNAPANLPEGKMVTGWKAVEPADLEITKGKDGRWCFVMPDADVTLQVQLKSIQVDPDQPADDGADFGPAAAVGVVAVAAAGGAVLGAATYAIGTEVYLESVLPAGAAIPTSRQALAALLWTDAGKPEPASTVLYTDVDADETDAQKADRWCVEQGLLKDRGEETFCPALYVTRVQVIKAWNAAQKLKNN